MRRRVGVCVLGVIAASPGEICPMDCVVGGGGGCTPPGCDEEPF